MSASFRVQIRGSGLSPAENETISRTYTTLYATEHSPRLGSTEKVLHSCMAYNKTRSAELAVGLFIFFYLMRCSDVFFFNQSTKGCHQIVFVA